MKSKFAEKGWTFIPIGRQSINPKILTIIHPNKEYPHGFIKYGSVLCSNPIIMLYLGKSLRMRPASFIPKINDLAIMWHHENPSIAYIVPAWSTDPVNTAALYNYVFGLQINKK